MNTNLFNFVVDKENKAVKVEREFSAPLGTVWTAWTDSKVLDKWWAPKPWKAKTKSMDFKDGGTWLYSMVGPQGEEHWSRFDYHSIKPETSFSYKSNFCDEEGKVDENVGSSEWSNTFSETGDKTHVSINIVYADIAVMEQMLAMGFKEGFTMGLGNLDEVLASK